jgi:ribosomal protein S7
MSRRHAAEKREILPDAKYGDRILTKFMNNLMTDGKKSVAISVVLQPRDKTLTDSEIETVMSKIVADVTKKTGAALRG